MATMRPSEALKSNQTALLKVLDHYGLTNPRLFGSVARGDDTPDSDMDVLVSKTRPLSYTTIARLRREASEALGCKVDVVFETTLRPDVAADIHRDLRPLI